MKRILAFLLLLLVAPVVAAEPTHILIVVGPSNHPPGSHEVAAGGRLMKHCLENMANLKDVQAEVVTVWPKDVAVLDRAASVIFIGDFFPPTKMPDSKAIMAKLDQMMKRGCGIVCVHFATGLDKVDVAVDGEHPLLHWLGGYFATYCVHHQSIAKIFPDAKITPAAEKHPVSRGWKEFTLHDEPYINNYFGKDENKLAPNVTALATSLLPPEAPKRETVAWCVERKDGGRGFGIVMPHFYRNWKLDDLRRFILNGIVWTAKLDVPADGVQTTLPDLNTFAPLPVKPAKPADEPKKAMSGEPIEYQPFFPDKWKEKKQATTMVPWEGQRVVLLTTEADFDGKVMARFLDRLDSGWKLYADLIVQPPALFKQHNGKVTIAAVPHASYTCGFGCGHVGLTGIEVSGFYKDFFGGPGDYDLVRKDPDVFAHYYFYEMGRNYNVFGDRHSAFGTGFAVFMRCVCMDTLECKDPDKKTRETINRAEAIYADGLLTFTEAFLESKGLKDKDGTPISPTDANVMYASVMLKLRQEYGGDAWVKRFYNHIGQCPPIDPSKDKNRQGQALYWVIAASAAAKQDLSPLFEKRWRFPLRPEVGRALKAVDWGSEGLTAKAVLDALPDLDTLAPLPVPPAAEAKKPKPADPLIQKDTVWSGDVVVKEEVRVRKAKVTIEPGTKVEFQVGGRINLEGGSALLAKGTADKPVRFLGEGTGAITGDNCSIVLERCQLEGLGAEKEPFLRVSPGADGVTLRGCSISDCSGIALSLQGPFEMTGCDVRRPNRKLSDHASGLNAHGKGTKVTIADNTFEHMSLGGYHANADIHIRGNIAVYGGFTGWGISAEKMVFEDNYVHSPVQKATYGLGGARGVIRNNVIRGAGWTCAGLGGDISGNLIMSLPHEDAMKLPGGFDQNCTHEHIVGLLPKAKVTRNIFIGASYGAVMGIGQNTCSESVIRNNTFDMLGHGRPVFLNHLTQGEVKDIVIRNNLMLRCGGIHNEDPKRGNSVAYADYSLWAAAGTKGRFDNITIEGKQPGDAGFGKHDVPPLGEKRELKPDEVVVNPDIEFPFSDADLLSRKRTPAEVLRAYRAAYALKPGSPAVNAGDPADKDDPEVQDGKPDIGAIEGNAARAALDDFFADEVWAKVAERSCLKCHKSGGDAEESKFVLRDPKRSEGKAQVQDMRHNRDAFAKMARLEEEGHKSRLLLKVVGQLEHGGKEALKPDSAEYRVLADFVRRVNAPPSAKLASTLTEDKNAPPFFDGIVMLDDRALLRRVTLSLAGRLPTDTELAAVAVGRALLPVATPPTVPVATLPTGKSARPTALPDILDAVMQEDAFYARLREGFNDIFHTVGILELDNVTATGLTYEHFKDTRLWYQKLDLGQFADKQEERKAREKLTQDHHKAMLDEPMKLIEHIVRNDLPFTEIVTADYIVVTPLTARAYGVYDELKPKFKNPDDPFEYVPVRLKSLVGHNKEGTQDSATGFYAHAGLLSNFQYLRRYPTTETNRNRLRARMYYQHFLGIDAMELAARVSDAAAVSAKYENPTLQASECVVCHKTIDPVAGLFQDFWRFDQGYGRRKEGWFTDMFAAGYEGEDLPSAERWRSLQWLGERTAKDPRFAVAMVEHVVYILTGRKALLPPKDLDDPLYAAKQRAYRQQRQEIEGIAARFAKSHFNLKGVFKDWIASSFYRADGLATATANPRRRVELDDLGLVRLLAPEQVERKLAAIFGQAWGQLNGPRSQLAILYGGIDSQEITERATDPSGAMGAIQRTLSNDVACKNVALDFSRPPAERRLFPHIEPDVIPGTSPESDARIRRAIVELHQRVLGRYDATDSPEVDRTYQLFAGIVSDAAERKGLDAQENYNCRQGLLAPVPDPKFTVRAWRGVVTYLLRQQEFLYE